MDVNEKVRNKDNIKRIDSNKFLKMKLFNKMS